jgi:hypothetical protein
VLSVVHKNILLSFVEPWFTTTRPPDNSAIVSCSGSLDAAPLETAKYNPFSLPVDWSLTKTLSPATKVTPSILSPASKPFDKFTFAVVATSAIILVLSPATASST